MEYICRTLDEYRENQSKCTKDDVMALDPSVVKYILKNPDFLDGSGNTSKFKFLQEQK